MNGKDKRYYVTEEKYNIYEICLGLVFLLLASLLFYLGLFLPDQSRFFTMLLGIFAFILFVLGIWIIKDDYKRTEKKYVKEETVRKDGRNTKTTTGNKKTS